ncbi:hypothetical protein LguiA_033215 [Lonicera macranthoides]
MDHLNSGTNKVMAMVELLFELIKGLIKDLDGPPEDEPDEEDFKEEQNSVARLIHMLYNDDPEEMLKIISTVRKHIMIGGPKRLHFTVPPLVFSALKLGTSRKGSPSNSPNYHANANNTVSHRGEEEDWIRLEPKFKGRNSSSRSNLTIFKWVQRPKQVYNRCIKKGKISLMEGEDIEGTSNGKVMKNWEDNINSSDEANLQFEDDELDSDEEGTVHNESSDGDIIRYQTSFEHFEEDGESLMRLFNKGDIRADRRLNITVISSEVFEEASRGNGAVKLAVYKVPTVSDGSIEVDMGDSGEVDSSIFLESIDSDTI